MSDYVEEFLKKYEESSADKIYFFGFSFGAYIALVASSRVRVDAQILCSISPYFIEDIPYLKSSWKKLFGKNRIKDFKKFKSSDIASNVNTDTFMLYGDNEVSMVKTRALDIHKSLKCDKHVVSVTDARHDLESGKYLREIERIIRSL